MNYRADVHHDPLGPATDIKPWPTGIAAYDTLTTEDRMPKKAVHSRIITLTVRRLRTMAAELVNRHGSRPDLAERLLKWADELDSQDARETRPDPSRRKARRRAKKL